MMTFSTTVVVLHVNLLRLAGLHHKPNRQQLTSCSPGVRWSMHHYCYSPNALPDNLKHMVAISILIIQFLIPN